MNGNVIEKYFVIYKMTHFTFPSVNHLSIWQYCPFFFCNACILPRVFFKPFSQSSSFPGMKRIHALTIQANYELRIDLEDFENSTSFAQYGSFGVGLFSVDPDEDGYPLSISDYSGTAGTCTL